MLIDANYELFLYMVLWNYRAWNCIVYTNKHLNSVMRAICNNLSSLVLEAVHNYLQKEQTEGDLLEPSSSISYHGFGCQVIDQQQSNEK